MLLSVGIALSQPAVLEKLNNYLFKAQYFNTYGLRKAVFCVELRGLDRRAADPLARPAQPQSDGP